MQRRKLIKTFSKDSYQVRVYARPWKSTIMFDVHRGRTFKGRDGGEVWTPAIPYNQRRPIMELSLKAERWVDENKAAIIAASRKSARDANHGSS